MNLPLSNILKFIYRKVIGVVPLLLCLAAGAASDRCNVQFWLGSVENTPQTNRSFALYPVPPQLTNQAGMIITRDRLYRSTDINGYVVVSNLLIGGYRSELQGTYTSTTNFFNFPASSGLLNAGDWVVPGSTNLPGGVYAYTQSQADGRFYPLASNPSNYLASIAPSNLPTGLSTSNYVGTFWLTTDRLTNGSPSPDVIWRAGINRPAMMSYDTYTDSAQFAGGQTNRAANQAAAAESNLLAVAISFKTNGIPIKWIEINDGWEATSRNAAGDLMWNPGMYPNGLPNCISNLHYLGYYVRLYTSFSASSDDPNTATTCVSPGLPATTFSTVQRDFNLWASWGIDGLFIDNCNDSYLTQADLDRQFMRNRAIANAVVATGRDLNVCAAVLSGYPSVGPVPGLNVPLNWEVPRLFNVWPSGADDWTPYLPQPGTVQLVMSNIVYGAYISRSGTLASSATNIGPGHVDFFAFFTPQDAYQCNDHSGVVYQTALSANVMVCATFSMGNPTRPEFSGNPYNNLTNLNIIRYLYDPAFLSGTTATSNANQLVMTRPLGTTNNPTTNLVWFVNYSNGAQTMNYTSTMSGWSASETFSVFEEWNQQDYGIFSNKFSISVPATSNYLFRVVRSVPLPKIVQIVPTRGGVTLGGSGMGYLSVDVFSQNPNILLDGLSFDTAGANCFCVSLPPYTTNATLTFKTTTGNALNSAQSFTTYSTSGYYIAADGAGQVTVFTGQNNGVLIPSGNKVVEATIGPYVFPATNAPIYLRVFPSGATNSAQRYITSPMVVTNYVSRLVQ
jgi:hypothetical protein